MRRRYAQQTTPTKRALPGPQNCVTDCADQRYRQNLRATALPDRYTGALQSRC